MLQRTRTLLWRLAAAIALVVGAIGLVLPVVPTVPFLIASAWAASKGWPALEKWLLEHKTFGPHIVSWRERRIIPRRAKWLATVMMSISAIGLQFTDMPLWARTSVPLVMFMVAVWLWRQPSG